MYHSAIFCYSVVDHQLILSDGLEKFFQSLRYSLFSVDLTRDQLDARYKRVEERHPEDRGFKRHLNYYATVCLLKENVNQGGKFVDNAIEIDSENIHTWCNKGFLEIKMEETEKAEEAAFKVLELIAAESTACSLRAKMDYGYWKAEIVRTEEARDECCEIMEGCLSDASNIPELQEYLSYSLLKILVRQLRSDDKSDKQTEWFVQKLSLAVNQLIVLYNSARIEYKADAWLWLVEIQFTNLKAPTDKILHEQLQTFCRETEEYEIGPDKCLQKALGYSDKSKNYERKAAARIAKNCLHWAYYCDADSEAGVPRLELFWFDKAVEISEDWIRRNYWVFMCSSTAAQALLSIWALKFYEENMDVVKEYYQHLYRNRLGELI